MAPHGILDFLAQQTAKTRKITQHTKIVYNSNMKHSIKLEIILQVIAS